MPSVFRRATKGKSAVRTGVAQQLEGTKPWTVTGLALTSTGLRDLDQILSGGQPLGTCLWLEEDRWTQSLALCLVQYWCAEAISQNQGLIIPVQDDREEETTEWTSAGVTWTADDDEAEGVASLGLTSHGANTFLQHLPLNLNIAKEESAQSMASSDTTTGTNSLETLEEDETEMDDAPTSNKAADEGLKIAWQYKASIQRERLGHSGSARQASLPTNRNVFCHSYDLQKSLASQMDVREKVSLPVVPQQSVSGFSYFASLLKQLSQAPPNKVTRLLLYHPDHSVLVVALPLILSYIRTNNLPVVILAFVRPWNLRSHQAHHSLRRTSDIVLSAESFASREQFPQPPEFARFQGLLHVSKVSHARPAADVFGLKRDRRKLHIELLHIPPEDYAASGGSAGGGVRSGAGRPGSTTGGLGCASSGGGGVLDF